MTVPQLMGALLSDKADAEGIWETFRMPMEIAGRTVP